MVCHVICTYKCILCFQVYGYKEVKLLSQLMLKLMIAINIVQ